MKAPALLLLALMLAAPAAEAQLYPTDRGALLVGGTAGFETRGAEGTARATVVSLNPSFGYFVGRNLALGASTGLTSITGGGFSETHLGIGPFIAYYFNAPGRTAFPFVRGSVAYTSITETNVPDRSAFGGELAAGYVFMVARNVGITAEAYGEFNATSVAGVGGSVAGNAFGVRAGVTAFIF
jgi:hypothetical protein